MSVPALDILVVDDSLENSELLAELIESYGHRVRSAQTGARALELLGERLARLVFLDLSLPDMDGSEVARQIRASWGTTCRIVALTGFSDAARREAAMQAGCDALLLKPLRIPQLEQTLRESAEVSP